MVEHRQEFDRELEAIEAKVIELFAMVARGSARRDPGPADWQQRDGPGAG